MTIQQLEEQGLIIFECISGSHAYGLNVPGSDIDKRGVFILPTKEVLAGRYIPQVSDEKNDITYYEIGRFLELAAKGNPNIIELLNIDQGNVSISGSAWKSYFPPETANKFLTMKLKHTFTGYAYSQIKKARGMNKKLHWEEADMVRKDVLDFCYVLLEKEESVKFKKWCDIKYPQNNPEIFQKFIGLAKVNNFPDMYTMYMMGEEGWGIIGKDSNTVRLSNIPKEATEIGKLRFDMAAYSTHCKDWREFNTWKNERNPARYRDNLKGEQGYDHKNMMHCMRLLFTARDIAEGKGVVVYRPEREYLLSIRNGEAKYQDLLDSAEEMVTEIQGYFDESGLPQGVKPKFVQDLLLRIRMENL